MTNNHKYGKAIGAREMPKPKRRLPQYDECLEEFVNSKDNYWEVNLEELPSQNVMKVLSSLKWRLKDKTKYGNIKVVMSKGKIFLEKVRS
jgi:hypothetical protein